MTPEQKAAFINAQAALLVAEISGMAAENMQRQAVGQSMAYPEEAFELVRKRYEGVLGHNAVIGFFHD